MKEPSDLAKALEIILKNSSSVEPAKESLRSVYGSPPVVAYGEVATPEGKMYLLDYWRAIRKHIWLVIGLAVITCSIAALRQARQPDMYQARARIQVDMENYSPALGASKAASFYVDNSFMDPEYFNTQVQILSSPTLLRRVVSTLDLEHNRTFLDQRVENRSTWQQLLAMTGLSRKANAPVKIQSTPVPEKENFALASTTAFLDDQATIERLAPYVAMLQGMLDVEQIKKTRLIDISADHTDAAVATKVVNATADAFALWNIEVKTRTNTIAGTYLQKRIAELQSQIRNGEEQLVNYAQGHEIVSLDASQNTVVERLSGLNKLLLEAENDRSLAESNYRASLMLGVAAANAEVSDKQIGEFKGRLAELKQKRAQLLLTDTEESPEVKDINKQIEVVLKQLEESRSSGEKIITTALESNYRKALERERTLRVAFNKQRSETVAQNQAAINYNILKQEIETNKGFLEGLMQRSKENDVTMAGTPNNIHVVDYAAIPKGPIGPNRRQGVLVALLLALAFGGGLALFLEYLDDTVKSAGDIESNLRLPSLATIPIARGAAAQRFLPIKRGWHRTNGHAGSGPELLMNSHGPTAHAEAYKHLRTSILLSTAGRPPRTLLVTSSVPAEGKTTTAVNTAIVLAQTGASVLLIDADLRRPRLHQLFGLGNTAGLSAILSSENTAAEILSKIEQCDVSNLYLLCSGAIPPNPAELLGSTQMKHLLNVVSEKFSYIVIDSPPISSFTDGVLVSALVEGVILVVHGGKTSQQVVRRTRQMLFEIGAKIIGVVLNRADLRSGDYYYHPYYYQAHQGPGGVDPVTENRSLSISSK